jgi:hypothetical protein
MARSQPRFILLHSSLGDSPRAGVRFEAKRLVYGINRGKGGTGASARVQFG